MKKIFSIIISITLLLSFVPAYAANSINGINMPTSDCELGFIFTTDGLNNPSVPDDYSGIAVISEELNIYYAADVEALNSVADEFNIVDWEEDFKIEIPEEKIDLERDTTISLFADEITQNTDNTDNEEPYLNDPFYEQMWHYDAIKAHAFHHNGITGGGIKVGIIDTGLTKAFKDFHDFDDADIQTGVNVAAYIEQARPGHEDESRLDCTEDNGYHGTAVASIICAKTNNEHGIAGLVDGCTVIPYKIEDYYYADDNTWLKGSALMKAIELAYQDDCDVVNISWGGKENSVSSTLNRIVDNCIQNGMIILAATGNSGDEDNSIEYPAACDNVIGVGATRPDCEPQSICFDFNTNMLKPRNEATPDDMCELGYVRSDIQKFPVDKYVKLELSTANESVFICAPGINIPAAECRTSQRIPNSFTSFLGTSAATPIVASAAIGVKQMRPYVDTDMFKDILKATAVDLEDEGYDINTGYGMVNFERIYDYVSQMPLTAPERTPEVAIDYENEQIVGFPINREYTVNGEAVTLNEDYTLPIKEEWFGTTVKIVKKASSDSYEDSEPQELVIPVRPSCPDTVYGTETGIANDNRDMISYKPVNGEEWTRSNVFISLPTGMYLVKSEGTATSFGSTAKKIYVGRQNLGIDVDYKNETLVNFGDGENYTINGEAAEINNKSCIIAADWFGTTVSVVRKAANSNDEDITQEINIPTRPEAPTGLSGDKGKIIGTTKNMEYCKQGGKQWISCSDETTLLGSSAGVYQVRIKQSDTDFAGEIAIVQVGLPIPAAEIDYKNETLKSFENGENYTINGQDVEINNKTCPIVEEWFGTTVSVVRKASSKYMNDSEPQMLDIPARKSAPIIDVLSDNTVNVAADIIYKEKNSDNWQTNNSDDIITLEPGKTYVFKVQYTENSFASEVRQITVQFASTEQYDIETAISYNKDTGECVYSAVNNTIWTINAIGIIAVYAQNGVLRYFEMIDAFPASGINKKLNFELSDGSTVKFFVWDSLQSMKPRDKVKLSECVIAFGEAE